MQRRVWRHGTVSAVGFGAMSFGGFYGPTDEASSMRTLARALELGVDFWDTANVYGDGLCEKVIGKFLAEDTGRRSKVTLATKFAIRRSPTAGGYSTTAPRTSAKPGRVAEAARSRRIDLYYVHRIDRRSRSRTPSASSPARQSRDDRRNRPQRGRARHPSPRRAAHPIAAVQSEYSLWTRNAELGLIQAAPRQGRSWSRSRRSDAAISAASARGRDVRRARFRHTNPRFRASTGGATAIASAPISNSPEPGA